MQEFIFSIHEGKLRRRSKTRIGGFTENQNLTINGTVNISSLFIAASLSGQDNSTIYVYCWNDDHKLVEVAGSGNVWTAKPVTNIVAKHSKKLAVTRTKDGLSLVFMNVHDKINFVSRNAAGVWSEAKGTSQFSVLILLDLHRVSVLTRIQKLRQRSIRIRHWQSSRFPRPSFRRI